MDAQAEAAGTHYIRATPHPHQSPSVTLCLSVSYLHLHLQPCGLLLPRLLRLAISVKTTPEDTHRCLFRRILAIPVSPFGRVLALTREHAIPLTTALMSIVTHQLGPIYIRRLEDILNGTRMSGYTNLNVLITCRPNATSPHVHLETIWRNGRGSLSLVAPTRLQSCTLHRRKTAH